MTIIDPYYIDIDSEPFATYAKAIEVIDGLENIPGRRIRENEAAYVDGSYPPTTIDTFFTEKQQRLRIWVAPFDADGNVTYAGGPRAHLRENVEGLFRLLGGSGKSQHTVTWRVPTPAGGTKTLQNTARISTPLTATGATRLVRRFDIFLIYPWPFWRDTTTGLITVGPTGSNTSTTPGGTAPAADAVYTCTAAGRITHAQSGHYHEITAIPGGASSVIIDQRARTILTDGGADARAVYNSDWGGGLRLPAGALANLTITGTWQLDYYNSEH
jgi:hypothetical protein